MRLTTFPLTSALIVLFVFPRATFADPKETAKALNEFFEAEWNYEMEQNPARASSMGDRRWNDRWGDQSLEAIRQREEHATEALARLKKFDRTQLPSADQLNYDLFEKDPGPDDVSVRARPACGRYRDAPDEVESPARDRFFYGERSEGRERYRERDRPIYFYAWPSVGLQDWRAQNQRAARTRPA
jgi:hypothetical protein